MSDIEKIINDLGLRSTDELLNKPVQTLDQIIISAKKSPKKKTSNKPRNVYRLRVVISDVIFWIACNLPSTEIEKSEKGELIRKLSSINRYLDDITHKSNVGMSELDKLFAKTESIDDILDGAENQTLDEIIDSLGDIE